MRCFVTGASGYIGSYLVRRLLADGHRVAVLLRAGSNRAPLADFLPRVEVIEGNFDPASYRDALASFSPEAVFHLGWNGTTAPDRNGPHQISENVRAALDLLEVSHRCGARVFLSTGSQAEYGRVSGIISEDQPLRPETAYGVAKAALSQLIPAYCQRAGMQSIWMRIFSVYGPGDLPIHMLPTLINGLLERQRPALTAGGQQWDYLYIDDVVDAIARSATAPGLSGVFNLASGRVANLRSIIERVRDLIDPSLPVGLGDLPYSHDQVMHLEGNIARIREAIGWEPRTSLEDGLQKTVAWHKQQRLSA